MFVQGGLGDEVLWRAHTITTTTTIIIINNNNNNNNNNNTDNQSFALYTRYGDPSRFDVAGNRAVYAREDKGDAVKLLRDATDDVAAFAGTFERAISIFRCSYAWVSNPKKDQPRALGTVWFGQYAPSASGFSALYAGISKVPAAFATGSLYKASLDVRHQPARSSYRYHSKRRQANLQCAPIDSPAAAAAEITFLAPLSARSAAPARLLAVLLLDPLHLGQLVLAVLRAHDRRHQGPAARARGARHCGPRGRGDGRRGAREEGRLRRCGG